MINILIDRSGKTSKENIFLGNQHENLDETLHFSFPKEYDNFYKYITYSYTNNGCRITGISPLVDDNFIIASKITKCAGVWELNLICKISPVNLDDKVIDLTENNSTKEHIFISNTISACVSGNSIDVEAFNNVAVDENIASLYDSILALKNRVEENDKLHEQNEAIRKANELERQEAETTRKANESERISAEQLRVEAENTRKADETKRQSNESARIEAETNRDTAESERVNAENQRAEAETARQSAETNRASAENKRASAEANRDNAENERVNAETSRKQAESVRVNAETARTQAEANRVETEKVRVSAENAREQAEQSRVNAESQRVTAEATRESAERARIEAESAREQAEQSRVNDENLRVEAENKREGTINDLKEQVDGKITKFYASNQGETHIIDSDNGKIMDMLIYGKSWQFKTTGKNVLKCTNFSAISLNGNEPNLNNDYGTSINSVEPSNSVIVTQTKAGDKDNVSNYTNGYICIGFSSIILSKESVFSFDVVPTNKLISNASIAILYNDNNFVRTDYTQDLQIGKRSRLYFKINADGKEVNFIVIYISGVSGTFENFQIEEASSATSYEPYTGAKPSPSPEYPQDIKSVVNPTIKLRGANILKFNDLEESTFTKNGITFSSKDGVIKAKGTALIDDSISTDSSGTNHLLDGLTLESGKTYIYNPNPIKGQESFNCYLDFTNSINLGFSYSNSNINNATKVTDEQAKYPFTLNMVFKKGTVIDMEWQPQVLLNEKLIPYQPYTEQTLTLPITLNAVPVSSGGNVTIGGQQYVADYIDVERGKIVRRTKRIDLKNVSPLTDLSYGQHSNGIGYLAYNISETSNELAIKDIPPLSNAYIGDTWTNKSGFVYVPSAGSIIVVDDRFTDKATALSLINDVYIIYAMSNSAEEDLTAEQVKALKAFKTYYPTTNISVNSEQIEGYTVFNYPISMANGWNYVKQQLNDNRDYIYDTDLQSAEAYVNSEYVIALTELGV